MMGVMEGVHCTVLDVLTEAHLLVSMEVTKTISFDEKVNSDFVQVPEPVVVP